MKSKWQLFSSVFQIIVGTSAICAFIVLWAGGEDMTRWIVTLILSVAFVVLGVVGIFDYRSKE